MHSSSSQPGAPNAPTLFLLAAVLCVATTNALPVANQQSANLATRDPAGPEGHVHDGELIPRISGATVSAEVRRDVDCTRELNDRDPGTVSVGVDGGHASKRSSQDGADPALAEAIAAAEEVKRSLPGGGSLGGGSPSATPDGGDESGTCSVM